VSNPIPETIAIPCQKSRLDPKVTVAGVALSGFALLWLGVHISDQLTKSLEQRRIRENLAAMPQFIEGYRSLYGEWPGSSDLFYAELDYDKADVQEADWNTITPPPAWWANLAWTEHHEVHWQLLSATESSATYEVFAPKEWDVPATSKTIVFDGNLAMEGEMYFK